jgi:hypothetical protein
VSKVGSEGIIALLRERDLDHAALVWIVAGMQDSLPAAIARLERIVDYQGEYRATLSGRVRADRKSIEICDRATDVARSLLVGLRQVQEVGS